MSDGVSSPISAYLNSKRVEEAELERALLAEWVQLKPGVPRKFLQAMAAIGFPMSKVGIYRSDCEMVAVSDMWTQAVPHFLSTLKGMRLQVGAASTSRPGESFYHAPNTTSSHALEVKEFIGFGPYAFVRGWTAFYRDAADVVSLVDSIMNPSEAVMPLTYAAPGWRILDHSTTAVRKHDDECSHSPEASHLDRLNEQLWFRIVNSLVTHIPLCPYCTSLSKDICKTTLHYTQLVRS